MEAAGSRVDNIDWLGADGGKLAAAFGAGCVATWGFIQMVLIGPLKKQLAELKEDCRQRDERSAQRINQLETLLLLHGPGQLRQQLQAALSEERVMGDKG
ncbi:hypothetical protein [Sphingobium sp. HDIP04]|uniref:hypothetical protein n=1 Tax=Sphingobium sp. HDIP04 TaxID=428994 RepID=UPI000387695B|nr:hypothetical protein [Sphingobium sp. HDIP04]EQB03928.1 hypothetical protein L286_11225 [Sphingobium sp. HDIP04]